MTYTPLASSALATAYQRDWVKSLRAEIAAGKGYAFANADTPHELFHVMGMPVITNQWWSAVIAAKQLSEHYLDFLEAQGFHNRLPHYSALPLAAELEGDSAIQPWGGLPTPAILCARQSSDEHQKIFSLWAETTGAPLHLFSSPAIPDPAADWWHQARDDWENFYGTDRLDLMVAEMRTLIAELESLTGRNFDEQEFATYMAAIHHQETIFEDVSTMIAAAPKCPVRISEQIPNVMIPQWHRGSDWALAHAETFKAEVAARIRNGEAVCQDERIRMMWIGAGLWFDTGFYSAFEPTHGAVFAWSMYLPFAADGYLRNDKGDPLRTLAARVSAMNEALHQPPWAGAWLVKEAKKYRIDVAVMLVPEHDRFSGHGSWLIRHALEAAGIRVVEIWADMVDPRTWNRAEASRKVTAVLDEIAAG